MDVRHRTAPPGWAVHAVSTRPARDHRYGFAGIEAQSTGPGARAWIETAGAKAPVGRSVDRVEVHFLRGPGLGSFEVRVDGKPTATVATGQDTFAAGVARLDLEDGPHRLTFEARTRQPVRLFGASLERSVPGIVVDSAGIAASVTATLLRQDAEVMRDTLRRRSPDLIVLAHGTFDVAPWNTAEQHDQALGSLLQRLREALPGVALLVLSPVDYRGPIDDSRASPALASREKRALARKHGAAFWDLRAAMGGDRSIRNFRTHRMADPDQIHLNQKGGLFMGHRLAEALWGALGAHLARAPGCAPAGSPPSGR
ncbi:MAG: GDSL-type esterase/lipase family protein [Polyangiaceae bacterium]|nr:GDSL-type esterase/lipase family protein [Polyangiaceae bacterium]